LLCIGLIGVEACTGSQPNAAEPGPGLKPSDTNPANAAGAELAALREEVDRLKRLVPSQSHAMQDVGYHFTNLWFAGQTQNWPLATFYLAETRSHLRWAVRIIPVRETQAGDVDLESIRDSFDGSSLASVEHAIEKKDAPRFSAAYKVALEGCYSCHKASEKPYLRPRIPTEPEVKIINLDPDAQWPQ
jgi:hypothetical protein